MKYSLHLLVSIVSIGSWTHRAVAEEVYHAQGEFAGEPTATTVFLQSRLTAIPGPELDPSGDVPGAEGVASFEWSTTKDFQTSSKTDWLKARRENDYIVRAKLTNLTPGTRYFYRLNFGADKTATKTGPVRELKTLVAKNSETPVTFVMGSCQNYAFFMYGKNANSKLAPEKDRKLGYPSYPQMTKLKPDFFIGTGDIVYYDHLSATKAQTVPELRRKWHEQFRLPRLVNF